MTLDATLENDFRFDPYSPQNDADPFPAYERLREEFPLFWCEEAGMWVLSRYHDILNALQDWRTYSSAKGNLVDELPGRAGATLGSTDPPRHDRLRGLIQKAMLKSALEHTIEPLRLAARDHLKALRDKDSFDYVGDFSSRVTLDLDRGIYHEDFNLEKRDRLLQERGREPFWEKAFEGRDTLTCWLRGTLPRRLRRLKSGSAPW